jgi:DNA-binding beta-propeller fold protein YncE
VVRTFPAGLVPQHVVPSYDLKTLWVNSSSNTLTRQLERTFQLPRNSKPRDVKLSPDGEVFYVADLNLGGVWLVDGEKLETTDFLPTGAGAHGLYTSLSGDGSTLWLTSRYGSEICAIDVRSGQTLATVRVGAAPHGLTVYPQPGRYSLGHTGILR